MNIGDYDRYPYPWKALRLNWSFTMVGKTFERVSYHVFRANRQTRRRKFVVIESISHDRHQIKRIV